MTPRSPSSSARAARAALLFTAAAVLAACATTGPAAREAAALARFQAAAGEPVAYFRYFSLQGYTSLGDTHVAVWTKPREAWLVKVDPPCLDLGWTQGIGLSSSLGRVHARFDRIHVGQQHCRIAEIRPVDVAMLREREREARREALEPAPKAQPAGGT